MASTAILYVARDWRSSLRATLLVQDWDLHEEPFGPVCVELGNAVYEVRLVGRGIACGEKSHPTLGIDFADHDQREAFCQAWNVVGSGLIRTRES